MPPKTDLMDKYVDELNKLASQGSKFAQSTLATLRDALHEEHLKNQALYENVSRPPATIHGIQIQEAQPKEGLDSTLRSQGYVDPDSVQRDHAQVYDTARVEQCSIVRDDCIVQGEAVVQHSHIGQNALIQGTAFVSGATVLGHSVICGDACIFGGEWIDCHVETGFWKSPTEQISKQAGLDLLKRYRQCAKAANFAIAYGTPTTSQQQGVKEYWIKKRSEAPEVPPLTTETTKLVWYKEAEPTQGFQKGTVHSWATAPYMDGHLDQVEALANLITNLSNKENDEVY